MHLKNKTYGNTDFELSATASSNLNVSYVSSDESVVTINGSTVTIIGAGTSKITASQPGNNNFHEAPSVAQQLVVNKADQTITITPVSDKLTSDPDFDVEAVVDSGLDLEYSLTGPASITGETISLQGIKGTVEVTVSQPGNGNYNSTEASISFDVLEEVISDVVDNNLNVNVFPNPATNWIQLEGNDNTYQVDMLHLNGEVVISKQVETEQKLQLGELKAGVYILKLTHNNHMTITKLLIE